jgi:histidine triad (HIT) family protein
MSSHKQSDCIFCKIASKQIPTKLIYEDELLVAFNDLHPKASTHVLLVPKLHIENLFDSDQEKAKIIGHMANSLAVVATKLGLAGFRTIINTGQEGSQEIMHLHMHILHGKLKAF